MPQYQADAHQSSATAETAHAKIKSRIGIFAHNAQAHDANDNAQKEKKKNFFHAMYPFDLRFCRDLFVPPMYQ